MTHFSKSSPLGLKIPEFVTYDEQEVNCLCYIFNMNIITLFEYVGSLLGGKINGTKLSAYTFESHINLRL